jgi:arylsulfatase A-like enzyme
MGRGAIAMPLLAFLGFVWPVPHGEVDGTTTPPNLVLIVTDDMRADLLDDMPLVQRDLVRPGRIFKRAFVVDPVCCPSRVSTLRGQYAHSTSVFDLDGAWGGWNQMRRAGLENSTLATWLTPTHFTALVGKYVNGYNVASAIPAGWDRWRAMMKPGYDPGRWNMSSQGVTVTPSKYSTTAITDESVGVIEDSGDEPVFLWVGYYAPHSPATPESRYATETQRCGDVDYRTAPAFNEAGTDRASVHGLTGMKDKARWLRDRSAWTPAKALVEGRNVPLRACRSLLSADDGVARIIQALEEKDPGLDDTVIVFTSDQGIQYGEHNWTAKRVPFEGTVRVPFVVRADGLLPPVGPTVDAFNSVLNIDLAPTLLELAGVEAVPGCPTSEPYASACAAKGGRFDGKSFARLLTGAPMPIARFSERTFLIEMYDDDGFPTYCAVRSPHAKLIRYVRTAGPDYEGYDLTGAYGPADPDELHSIVFSDAAGVIGFRGGGQELFEDLYPSLVSLCDPLPPTYPPF